MGIAHNGNERPERDYHNYILIAAGLAFLLFALWDRGPEHETTGSASSLYPSGEDRREVRSGGGPG